VQLDTSFAVAWAALARLRLTIFWAGLGNENSVRLAELALERARTFGPDLPETHLAQGYYFFRGLRDDERALEEFSLVLRDQPGNSEAMLGIADIHRRQGRWDEALSGFAYAAQLDPLEVLYPAELAHTSLFLRRYEEAERYLRRALSIAPENVYANGARLKLPLKRGGTMPEAREAFSAAYEAAGTAGILTTIARHYRYFPVKRIMIADIEEALRDSAVAERLRNVCEYCLLGLEADVATRHGDADIAMTYFNSSYAHYKSEVEKSDGREEVFRPIDWRNLGRHAARLGRRDEAIEAAERAAELLPLSKDAWAGADILLSLAEVYVLVGDHDKALDQLDHLLSIPSTLSVPLMSLDPMWEPLRDRPRYQALLEKHK
jgi:serine/threonine-protein kinase